MRDYKALTLSLVLSSSFLSLQAQVSLDKEPNSGKINSPYSRFGIGNIAENKSIGLRGMGGTANGYSSEQVINTYNPASYSFLNTTSFEFGLIALGNSAKIGEDVTKSSTLTISHLNLAFPLVKNRLALNIGYMPLTSVYYNSKDSLLVPGFGNAIKSQTGNGGLNLGFLGLSGGYKGFSVGVNAGYAFGSIANSSYFNSDSTDNNNIYTRVTDYSSKDVIGGLYLKGGLMYRAVIQKNKYLSFGGTASLTKSLNATRTNWLVAGTQASVPGSSVVTDTINANYDFKGKLTLPKEYGVGVHYGKNNVFDVGLDFNYSDWSSFQRFTNEVPLGVGQSSYRLALGGEFLPNPKATTKEYLSAITYRLGAYYGKDYFKLNATDINYMGGTIGLQLPFKPSANSEQMGSLNMALDIGSRGTLDNNLAKETYTRFTIGLKINAKWFQRRAFD